MLGRISIPDICQTGPRCPCIPLPAFFPREGPDSVAPVVIPAMAQTLDELLRSYTSLCPVRALRYYLDRTSGRTRS